MENISGLLKFAEDKLQIIALIFMGTVYFLRIRWLLGYKAGKERQAKTGLPGTSRQKGILYSWANIAMPWAMESTRTNFLLYSQFVIFHIGVVASITMSFLIPYAPGLMAPVVVTRVFQVLIGAACLVGCLRIFRRITDKYVRAISTPDDYFSLTLLTVWFFTAFMAAPNKPEEGEFWLLVYFIMTAFFLVYVPFSKISHYLYYPFTRYYFGKTMGHRGVFPLRRGPRPPINNGARP